MLERKCGTCYWNSEITESCLQDNCACFKDKDGEKRNWKPYTHGDAIRAMTDEELGEMIFRMAAVAKLWDFNQMQSWLESPVSDKRGFWG